MKHNISTLKKAMIQGYFGEELFEFEKELREIMNKEKRRPDLTVVYIKDILGEET